MRELSGAVWLTWSPPHRRTRELAGALGLPLYEYFRRGASVVRYGEAALRSWWLVLRIRPRVVFVQVPSIVLAAFMIVASRLLRFRVICDQHNETVEPFIHTWDWYRRLCAWVIRGAAFNIVTNDALARVVESLGGRAAVLPDRIPSLPGCSSRAPGRDCVVFICSFAADEPYQEVIEAARSLEGRADILITGNRGTREFPNLPRNVHFTGYLPDAEYVALLCSANVIVDLTLMENCLVCGAYEAIALHRPLVTSSTAALREYFGDAAVYCAPDREAIARAMVQALDRQGELEQTALHREQVLRAQWNGQLRTVVDRTAGLLDE